DGVMRHHAERPAAVGDYLAAPGKLIESLLELVDRDRSGAFDVPGVELVAGANVDEDDVVAAHPLQKLVAVDALDLLAEIVAGRAPDLGQAVGRGVPERQPKLKDVLTGKRIAHLIALALTADEAGGVQGLEVLGCVGDGLLADLGQLIDAARALGQEI